MLCYNRRTLLHVVNIVYFYDDKYVHVPLSQMVYNSCTKSWFLFLQINVTAYAKKPNLLTHNTCKIVNLSLFNVHTCRFNGPDKPENLEYFSIRSLVQLIFHPSTILFGLARFAALKKSIKSGVYSSQPGRVKGNAAYFR